ncbi:MAG: hypothetical protein A2X94_08235 [Bdellovibrionales bacterium GWB1_55_8]|nr:MAG: hypothetical protein A2X94_08235 [Bdellovibrionales bacterium GWB1_55_8]
MLPRILIVYTGGTFGMKLTRSGKGDRLSVPRLSSAILRKNFLTRAPELQELAKCDVDVLMNCDSAHIGPKEWCEIADHIRSRWMKYDGIIVLHGTDTLAYTASALSFLLLPCPRPVILTGAQRPFAALRSDARRNLVSAVEIAASGPRPLVNQVSVFFDDRLFQGNRVHKKSATDYHAFDSPFVEPIATVGTDIRYRKSTTGKRQVSRSRLRPSFSSKVALVHATPGFPARVISEHLLPQLDGIVLNVFASGTAPTHDPEFRKMLRAAKRTSTPVIVVSEGGSGADPSTYEAGQILLEEGCLWAGGMTLESCFVKASLLLGQQRRSDFKRLWRQQIAGEG